MSGMCVSLWVVAFIFLIPQFHPVWQDGFRIKSATGEVRDAENGIGAIARCFILT